MSADAMAGSMPMSSGEYPVRFDAQYQESHSRLLLLVRWILAIPQFLIVYALRSLSNVIVLIAFFAILFTKKYPRGLFDILVNVYRWDANVTAYFMMLRDEYPPFTWDPGLYPVTWEVDYPEEMSRFAPLYKWLLVIPNIVVLFFVWIVAIVLWIVGWFAILFTGKLPHGIHDFIVGSIRWSNRANAYAFLLVTDKYPPFSMKP